MSMDHTLAEPVLERYHESRRYGRATYTESYDTKYTRIRMKKHNGHFQVDFRTGQVRCSLEKESKQERGGKRERERDRESEKGRERKRTIWSETESENQRHRARKREGETQEKCNIVQGRTDAESDSALAGALECLLDVGSCLFPARCRFRLQMSPRHLVDCFRKASHLKRLV